jgi:ketosteroid isomerase-like protein
MAFTGSADDRQIIRERLETYADAVARQDLDTYLSCWAHDGRRTGAGGECQGHDGLRDHWNGVFGAVDTMAFFVQVASIDVDVDRAAVRSYCLEIMQFRDGNGVKLVGEYTDVLVRRDADWVFAHRDYQVRVTF